MATYTERLRTGLLADHAAEVRIVRVGEPPRSADPREIVAWLLDGRTGTEQAATALNDCDVAVVHHEFGIYSGADGQDVLRVADLLRVPAIAALHTVPAVPSPHRRAVLEVLMDRMDAIAVMSDAGAERLLADYAVDAAKIAVIPHGADIPSASGPRTSYADGDGGRPATILTWGLLRPGKGIEWGLEALPLLRSAGVEARYVVAGQTHPKVREAHGESYRTALLGKVRELGIEDMVELDDSYRSAADLADLIAAADVVLLPYESTEQVASGALVQAVASGRPVVASAFPHACEVLGTGAGLTVPHRDPRAIASAVELILTEPGAAAAMAERARSLAPGYDWKSVSAGYGRLARLVNAERSGAAGVMPAGVSMS